MSQNRDDHKKLGRKAAAATSSWGSEENRRPSTEEERANLVDRPLSFTVDKLEPRRTFSLILGPDEKATTGENGDTMIETAEKDTILILRAKLEEMERELEGQKMRVIRETIASRQAKLAADRLKSQLLHVAGSLPAEHPSAEEEPDAAGELFAMLLAQADDLKEQLSKAAQTAQEAQRAISR